MNATITKKRTKTEKRPTIETVTGPYALRLEGNFMEPTAKDGDYVVLERACFVNNGSVALVSLNGEIMLRRVFYQGNRKILKADNLAYKTLRPKPGTCRIIAGLRGFYRKRRNGTMKQLPDPGQEENARRWDQLCKKGEVNCTF
jgi:SOS-response transcriptional repressor LexA